MKKTSHSFPKIFPYLTCEHASPRVPRELNHLFGSSFHKLPAHRKFDVGAADLTRFLSHRLDLPYSCGKYSRLVVDLNRSIENSKSLFSIHSPPMDSSVRDFVLARFYKPYRNSLEKLFTREIRLGKSVLQISIHSFTPILRGRKRNADVGILYDPSRFGEKKFSDFLRTNLIGKFPTLKIRKNYPYRGTDDSLTGYFRKLFLEEEYLGIELEVNQKFPIWGNVKWRLLKENLLRAIADTLKDMTR